MSKVQSTGSRFFSNATVQARSKEKKAKSKSSSNIFSRGASPVERSFFGQQKLVAPVPQRPTLYPELLSQECWRQQYPAEQVPAQTIFILKALAVAGTVAVLGVMPTFLLAASLGACLLFKAPIGLLNPPPTPERGRSRFRKPY